MGFSFVIRGDDDEEEGEGRRGKVYKEKRKEKEGKKRKGLVDRWVGRDRDGYLST